MEIKFKFAPLQYIHVIAFDLNYEGRVIRCIFDGGAHIYSVQYAFEGKLETREFYEDELAARSF
jgi:hypothetical protein